MMMTEKFEEEEEAVKNEFLVVTYTSVIMRTGVIWAQKHLILKKFIDVVRKVKRLLPRYIWGVELSYGNAGVTIKNDMHEDDREILYKSLDVDDDEIEEEEDIPYNSELTECFVDFILQSRHERYSKLKKKIIAEKPTSLSFFTRDELTIFKKYLKRIAPSF